MLLESFFKVLDALGKCCLLVIVGIFPGPDCNTQ